MTMKSTMVMMVLPAKSRRILMSMPTPMRKYGINRALPMNSRRFISGAVVGMKRLSIKPLAKAPRMPSKPITSHSAALINIMARTKMNCMTESL